MVSNNSETSNINSLDEDRSSHNLNSDENNSDEDDVNSEIVIRDINDNNEINRSNSDSSDEDQSFHDSDSDQNNRDNDEEYLWFATEYVKEVSISLEFYVSGFGKKTLCQCENLTLCLQSYIVYSLIYPLITKHYYIFHIKLI